MDKFLRNNHGLFLAYDQGFEHGPSDFNAKNVDPAYILDIAKKSGVFTGVIFQKGIAEKYYPRSKKQEAKSNDLPPLIIKLNGKTAFHVGEEPFAPLLCSVDEALELGASGVGYTVYVGSEREAEMTETFGRVVGECNQKGIPTIGWFYLRGKHVVSPHDPKKLAYAAAPSDGETIVEIGPGKGVLTRELLQLGPVVAIEKDEALVQKLQ